MRSTIVIVILCMLVVWTCEQQQQQQQQQHQPLHREQNQKQKQKQQQLKYHNISIIQNAIDSDMPLALQNSIAACCSIIQEYFMPSSNSFMLSMNVQETYLKKHTDDFLNNVLLNLSLIKVEIENSSMTVLKPSYNRKFNLIVVDSIEALRKLNPAHLTRDYDIQEYHLLYLMHASRFSNITEVLQEIFSYFWQNSILNVSLLITDNLGAEVFTYFPFDSYMSCKMPTVKQVNYFSGRWEHSIHSIFPQKIVNLHKCPLTAAVWDTPPYFSYWQNNEGYYEIGYFEAELLEVLADKLNFSINLVEPPNDEQRGRVLANGSLTGALKMLNDRFADLSLGSFRYDLERSTLLTAALPYYQTYQTYGILISSQLYTSLEILLYPFDTLTWFCILSSIIFGIVLSIVINRFYDKSLLIQLVIGKPRLETPLVDITSMFLGQILTRIPETNLTRFVIILWHIYGLLLRTAYQSLIFQLLKLSLYHEPPQTLGELIDNRCTLVMTLTTYETVYSVPRIGQGLIDVIKLENTSELSSYIYLEENKKQRCLAAVSPKDFLTYHLIKEHKRGLYYVLPEYIFTQHITMYFSKHSLFIDRFNELLMNLRSMGLINFWALKSLDSNYLNSNRESAFKPVKVEDLEGVLMIYGVLNLAAICVFCLEIVYFQLKILIYGRHYEFVN